MRKMFRTTAMAATLAFGLAGNAQAEDIQPYAGASLGSFNLDAGLGKANAFGGFGFVGADFNDYIAAELRVGTTGTASLNVGAVPTESTADWFVSYLAKVKLPVNDKLRFYAVVGGTTMKAAWSIPGFVTLRKTATDFSYGGGAEYAVNDQMKAGVEWVQYTKKANPNVAFPGLDVYGISATLSFGF